MILSGNEIKRQVALGRITISPFCKTQVNPNSYNYCLGETYREVPCHATLGFNRALSALQDVPYSGLTLQPGRIYLCHTKEAIGSEHFVTSLIGRSSVGRLGLFLQLSADMGNLGPAHRWTLELTCAQPVIVYPGMIIGQLSFWLPTGPMTKYIGRYTDYSVPTENLDDFRGSC